MRRIKRLLFSAQKIGRLYGDAAEDLVLGVNDPPLAWDFGGFCGKGLHRSGKGPETTDEGGGCQLVVQPVESVGNSWGKRGGGGTAVAYNFHKCALTFPSRFFS